MVEDFIFILSIGNYIGDPLVMLIVLRFPIGNFVTNLVTRFYFFVELYSKNLTLTYATHHSTCDEKMNP